MGCEIERKFLVASGAWKTLRFPKLLFRQGYIRTASSPHVSVRIRMEGENAFLTLKGPLHGITRSEFQYAIPVSDAEVMLSEFTSNGKVEKYRTRIPLGSFVWEIDEYLGDNDGLVTAEIELPAENTVFERPDWLGREVTGVSRYYNSMLAVRPYSLWTPDERQ